MFTFSRRSAFRLLVHSIYFDDDRTILKFEEKTYKDCETKFEEGVLLSSISNL